jgi:hypothetical protein
MLSIPLLLLSVAVPDTGQSAVARPAEVSQCLDAQRHPATCGYDQAANLGYNECYGTNDPLGRCPGDPHCFDAHGQDTRCVFPIEIIEVRCADGTKVPVTIANVACIKRGGVSN